MVGRLASRGRLRRQHPLAFADGLLDRTLKLLNRLSRNEEDITALLIELAVVEEHPWNVELLHRNLISRNLAERDAFGQSQSTPPMTILVTRSSASRTGA